MLTLSADRKTVRLNVPPLPVAGLAKSFELHIDWDVETVDAMMDRLIVLRTRMLPARRSN